MATPSTMRSSAVSSGGTFPIVAILLERGCVAAATESSDVGRRVRSAMPLRVSNLLT
jgi:hypothetical protein